jgi:predicted lipase
MSLERARAYPHFEHVNRYHNSKTDVLADVWKTGSHSRVISFRGSASLRNLVAYCRNDMETFSFCDKAMNVHTGILELLDSIHDDILHSIEKQRHVLFTGYSLGGALAMLAALYFALVFPRIQVSCHTFGTPMVGDRDFISLFDIQVPSSVHIVNQLDIVPHLLPYPFACSNVCNRYHPVSIDKRIYIPSKDLKKDILHTFCHPLHFHDITTYIENLEHLLERSRTP